MCVGGCEISVNFCRDSWYEMYVCVYVSLSWSLYCHRIGVQIARESESVWVGLFCFWQGAEYACVREQVCGYSCVSEEKWKPRSNTPSFIYGIYFTPLHKQHYFVWVLRNEQQAAFNMSIFFFELHSLFQTNVFVYPIVQTFFWFI